MIELFHEYTRMHLEWVTLAYISCTPPLLQDIRQECELVPPVWRANNADHSPAKSPVFVCVYVFACGFVRYIVSGPTQPGQGTHRGRGGRERLRYSALAGVSSKLEARSVF